MARLKNMKQI